MIHVAGTSVAPNGPPLVKVKKRSNSGEPAGYGEKHGHQHVLPQQRQRDGEEPSERAGPVQYCRLVEVAGDAPQCRKEDHHVKAGKLPARHHHDGNERRRRLAEPRLREVARADGPKQRIEQARAIVEHECPENAGCRHGEHHWREVETPQQREALPFGVEEHSDTKSQRHFEHERTQDIEHDVHVTHQVRAVGEGPLEIGKPRPARCGEPVPVGEGVEKRRPDRQQHKGTEQQ